MEKGFPPKGQYKVFIRCNTYNQSQYIEDALKGFVSQQTSFPFLACIFDDASTDGEQGILRNWINNHCEPADITIYDHELAIILMAKDKDNRNCTYAFHLLKKNLFFKPEKQRIHNFWRKQCEYEALCEGDDYWTDPHKLQKQVDWLENHPNCVMVCSDATIETPTEILDWHRYDSDCNIPVKDMILGGGLFVQTATLLYRKNLLENYPDFCRKCHVGDYPLQIWATLRGDVRYLAEKTATYRFQHAGSWTSKNDITNKNITSEISMLRGLDKYSDYKYHLIFENKASTKEFHLASHGVISPIRFLHPRYWNIPFGRKDVLLLIFNYYKKRILKGLTN